jgi:hypothetical protein
MRVEQAVKHFDNKAGIAKALGIDRSLVTRWKGGIVPIKHAWKLRTLSKGKLSMRLADYR